MATGPKNHKSGEHRWVLDLMAAVLCLVAWWIAWQQTRDLVWPCESDHMRDMGAAQSILDGQGGADPAYLAERWWYNPLVPAVVGIASRAANMPVSEGYARLGTHLNLIAPLGFYGMMAVLFSRRAALAGLAGFLFLGPIHRVSWLHATYSPWLWPCNFSQGLFYLAILLLIVAYRRGTPLTWIAAGLLVGLTMLAHTAPGVLLAMAMLVLLCGELRSWRFAPRAAARAIALTIVVTVVALATASPFWMDVFVHLRRGVRNPAPMEWLAGELALENLPHLVRWHTSTRGVFALIGLIHVLAGARRHCRYARRLVLTWTLGSLLLLIYGFVSQRIKLSMFLPSWHFYFYLHALESVLFGVGIAAVARGIVRRAHPKLPSLSARTLELGASVAAMGALLILCAARYGKYQRRMDLVDNRRDSIALSRSPTVHLYNWILNHTKPDDVILADPWPTLDAIAAAGRKVVAMPHLFSNPYVELEPRSRDASAMLQQVRSSKFQEFIVTANMYHVRYLALPAAERDQLDGFANSPLRRVFSAKDAVQGLDVYEVHLSL